MKHIQGQCKIDDFHLGDILVDSNDNPIKDVLLINFGIFSKTHEDIMITVKNPVDGILNNIHLHYGEIEALKEFIKEKKSNG